MAPPCVLSAGSFHAFVTHWDLDGVVSAALLVRTARLLGLSYDYRLSTPAALPRHLRELGAPRLVVADLSPRPGAGELAALLSRFEAAAWLDHHEWPADAREALGRVPGLTVILDTSRAAAELVYGYLTEACGVELEGYRELVELARLEDEEDVVEGEARLWRVLLRMSGWELRYRVVDALASDPATPGWAREEAARLMPRYERMVREAARRARVLEAPCGARVAVVESPPSLHPGDIVASLGRAEADVYVILYPDAVSLRSEALPVNRLAWRLGGGGHPRAAGAPARGRRASELVARVLEEVCRLVPELAAEIAGRLGPAGAVGRVERRGEHRRAHRQGVGAEQG